MIKGIGIDLVDIDRFKKTKDKKEFLKQFFSDKEIGYSKKDSFHSIIFAIKEAILKALGCGLYHGTYWHDIEIIGKYKVALSGFVKKFAKKRAAEKIHISWASSGRYAISVVLLQE